LLLGRRLRNLGERVAVLALLPIRDDRVAVQLRRLERLVGEDENVVSLARHHLLDDEEKKVVPLLDRNERRVAQP